MRMPCVLLLALLAAPLAALAQAYPARPVTLVVPYPPGAAADLIGRLVAQRMTQTIGQNVIVDNRPGASGNIGSDYVARQPPDGYSFVLGTDATHGTNQHMAKSFPYDAVRDFTPLTQAVNNFIVLVALPSFPANDIKGLLAYAKANPGKLFYGSSGSGSPHHLSGVLLNQAAGADLVHVPYKGGGPAVQDLIGGQIPLVFASLASVTAQMKAGKLKAIAVTHSQRYGALPDVPAIGETITGFEMSSWLGFFGPARLPAPITQRLSGEIVKALHQADVKSKLEASGLDVVGNTSEEFGRIVKTDLEKRGRLLKAAGVQPE